MKNREVGQSREIRARNRELRIFGLNHPTQRLLSFSQMTPFYRAWVDSINKNIDTLDSMLGSFNLHEARLWINKIGTHIPEDFANSWASLQKIGAVLSVCQTDAEFIIHGQIIEKLVAQLRSALFKDSSEAMFLCLSPTERYYYEENNQFGLDVLRKFGEITTDIDEAYKCMAVERYTASVFHCMRMLEYGVHKLAGRFGVDLQVDVIDSKTHQPTGDKRDQEWNALCQQILKKIKNLPATSEAEQEAKLKFEDLAIHLSNVRAERNAIMHARYGTTKRFTRKKAEHVLEETKSFISELALLLP
jgi:hypothetical protein